MRVIPSFVVDDSHLSSIVRPLAFLRVQQVYAIFVVNLTIHACVCAHAHARALGVRLVTLNASHAGLP